MSDEILNLIYDAAEREIELNHKSADLHQDDMQRVIASLITAKDGLGGVSDTELLLELVKNP